MQISPPSLFSAGLQGLNRSNQMLARSSERLATGLAINRGSDNPAGLIASEALRGRLASIDSTIRATSRNNMTLSIEAGALSSVSGSVADLRGLVVQGANAGGLTGAESGAISGSISSALQGMEFALGQAGSDILSDVRVDRQIGTDAVTGDPIYETLTLSDLPGLVESDPVSAQALVDEASSAIATRRGEIGAEQRANESMQRAMEEEQINVARAESSIRDTDYAKEASESVRASILGKASISVLLIGQEQSKRVLDLLM
ncbi:MAG: flagellin [Phycisphaerales bacterium]|nr:flagellin [Phycisphaerales bacterium]